MNGMVARRQRVLRVREVQHVMAAAETAMARDNADNIARNVQRLAGIRQDLFTTHSDTIGGSLAAVHELAGRLEQAGRQLDGALYDAHRVTEAKEALALVAHRDREIAEKLKARADVQLEEWRESRLAALPRYRRMQRGDHD